MKRFKELEITSNEKELIDFLDLLKRSETNKWKYEKKLTKDYAINIMSSEEKVACFKANSSKYYHAIIWMVISDSRGKNQLRVSNIVSREIPYLGKDLYNEIVTNFYNDFVFKYKTDSIKITLTSDDISIEEIANKKTAEKLKRWESSCNRSTGNSHPLERERWFDFIKTAVDTDSELLTGDLEQWLTEEKNWIIEENNVTERIILDFEYGRDLVKYYVGKSY